MLKPLVIAGVIAIAAPPLVALGLIASQRPVGDLRAEAGQGLDFSMLALTEAPELGFTAMRDGSRLGFRRWQPEAASDLPLLVLVHGSGWHGLQYAGLGAALAAAGMGEVIAPDLRGHGPSPARRGDIDHIGQLEEDLADLIAALARPGQRVVLLGHSSGGGLVIRMAGGAYRGRFDAAILLAPYLQFDAPTTRPYSGGWAAPLLRRIIGLTLLNAYRIHALDALVAVQFAFPDRVLDGPLGATATRDYSWRMNISFAPRRDWAGDVAGLPPFLLVAGEDDEAFIAESYAPSLAPLNDAGRYHILPQTGHLDIVDSPALLPLIGDFLAGLPAATP